MSKYKMTHFTGVPIGAALVDGAAAGDVTVSGVEAQDKLLAVYSLTSSTDVLSTADLTDEFSVSADDTIDNTDGTSSANGALLVIWQKVHPNGL